MMTDTASDRPHLSEIPEGTAQYRALNGTAIVSLLLALVSPVAFFTPALWLLPWGTAALAGFALWQIAKDPEGQTGRKAAVAGLCLAVLAGVAAPVDLAAYRWKVRGEARDFAAEWFDFVRANERFKAFELSVSPERRQPLDGDLTQNYPEGSEQRREFDGYFERDVVQQLLALGPSAELVYEDTESQYESEGKDVVRQHYTATGSPPEGPATLALTLVFERSVPKNSSKAYWRLAHLLDREKN